MTRVALRFLDWSRLEEKFGKVPNLPVDGEAGVDEGRHAVLGLEQVEGRSLEKPPTYL